MKAIVREEYGRPDVLKLKEVSKPSPKEGEVLVKIHASTVTSGDYKMRNSPVSIRLMSLLFGMNIGLRKPKNPLMGSEFAGEVEAIGKGVTSFKKGDYVFGDSGEALGANAEYLCMPEDGALTHKPANLTFEEAAALPRGTQSALFFLRDKADIQSGQEVLIYGASGSVGTYAVQLAKHFDATVTGVCSAANVEMVASIGADKVIDYTREDFTEDGEKYDLIYETVGKSSLSAGKNALKDDGVYIAGSGGVGGMVQMIVASITGGKKVIFGVAPELKEDLVFIKQLVEEGHIKPVIDRTYPLEQTAEAHEYVEKGHKKGNVVIVVAGRE